MHAQNNLTAPHTVLRVGLYMVQSSHSVVAISVNGFYHGQWHHYGNVNDCELQLAIYIKRKKYFKEVMYPPNKLIFLYLTTRRCSLKHHVYLI